MHGTVTATPIPAPKQVALPSDATRELRKQKGDLRDALKDLKKAEKKERRREIALNRKAAKVSLEELAQITLIKAQNAEKKRLLASTPSSSSSHARKRRLSQLAHQEASQSLSAARSSSQD